MKDMLFNSTVYIQYIYTLWLFNIAMEIIIF